MAYEALYRRYRPSRFKDAFFGQDHVVAALTNAIEGDRVGHAYMFSGPRGTGKTTSARILAKALNCTNLHGGEPCNECDSCLAFLSGGSYDLHELDAASNNGVDAMRDLIGKVALGSPGRTKVYILDEVHMLSSGAENALLKTLEEPPPHVVFVLCTTEPNKVVPTIRSRTQHLEFSLLSASQVGELIDHVIGDAGIEITPEDRHYVIRAGGGSARDTLSALDQVVAAGGAPQGGEHLEALFQSLIDRDAPAALGAIDGALQAGRDAAGIGAALLHELRTVFLAAMRADIGHLPEAERNKATTRAASMPPGRVTRAIEVIGASLIEMRQAPDPRVDLEVAVMRLTRTDLDTNPAALVERLEAIELQIAGGAPIVAPLTATQQTAAEPVVADASVAANAAPPAAAQPAQAQATAVNPPPAQAAAVTSPPAEAAPAHSSAAQSSASSAPSPDMAPPAPAAAEPAAPAATPTQQGAAPSAGKRGAAIARAELERQGSAEPGGASAAPPAGSPTDAPASTGKTLADVRRERQAATLAAAGAADPAVQANADARRERQAAAQAAGQASAPEDAPAVEPAPAAQVQPPPPGSADAAPADSQGAPAPVTPAQVPPVQAPPVQAPAEAQGPPVQAPPAQAPAEAQVPPVQAPPAHAPAGVQAPPVQAPPAAAPAEQRAPANDVAPAPAAAAPEPAPVSAAGGLPSLADLEAVWQPLLETMSGRARSRFSAGHFMDTAPDSVVFGLPNPVHRDRCEEIRDEFDQALAAKFARPIPLTLVVDETEEEPDFFAAAPSGGAGDVTDAQADALEEATVDVHNLVDATGDIPSAEDRVMATFENSVLLEDPTNQPPNQ